MSKKAVSFLLLAVGGILILILNSEAGSFNLFGFGVSISKAYVYLAFALWGMALRSFF
jgi:hypothetical protein